MPLEDDHSTEPPRLSTDEELDIAETAYYTRLAAKACFHTPDVVAVDGVPKMGELSVYVDADFPETILEDVLWLFGTDIEYPTILNTEEFGVVMRVELNIDSEDVVGLDVSNHEEHEAPYRVKDYIEDYIIAGGERAEKESEDPILYNHLPDAPIDGLETECIAETTTRNLRDYHPTMDGELERDATAWRESDGSWQARYKMQTARAATCYGALRKALDYHHREEFGIDTDSLSLPTGEEFAEEFEDESEKQKTQDSEK